MKTLILLLSTVFASTLFVSTSGAVPSDAENRAKCESKKDAGACFEAGFAEFKVKGEAHRKSAVRFFKQGCSLTKRKKYCSASETKNAARSYYGLFHAPQVARDQKVADTKNGLKVIKAPRLNKTSNASSAPYVAPSADHLQLQPAAPPPEPAHQPVMESQQIPDDQRPGDPPSN